MRDVVISGWLADGPWADWTRQPLAGDASSRRYERLVGPNGNTLILMDAPPDICGSVDPFLSIARLLREHGLQAPEIVAENASAGLLLLEDLGTTDFASRLSAHPSDEEMLYAHAVDLLIRLQDIAPPPNLPALTPKVAAEMLDPLFNWFAPDTAPETRAKIETEITGLFQAIDATPRRLSLRDFHAENLIWRPDRDGLARVGLLDFQDAFRAHPAYDLVSLLRDVRRDVSSDVANGMIARFASGTGMPTDDLAGAFAVLSVQRNLRILGVFARLARRDEKPAYLNLIPRVKSHVLQDLGKSELSTLRTLVIPLLDMQAGT